MATLLAERFAELFSSALAACAPIGSFRQQVNYLGDFRVLFDYYFPGVLPGSAVSMPEHPDPVVWLGTWFSVYVPAIQNALDGNPAKALELMRVAARGLRPGRSSTTVIRSATAILAYNVLGLNDAIDTLGGNPFGNRFRWYFGSSNDLRLNLLRAALRRLAGGTGRDGARTRPTATCAFRWSRFTPPPTRSPRWPTSCSTCPKVDRTDRGALPPVSGGPLRPLQLHRTRKWA